MPAHLVNVLSILFAYIMQILNGLTSLLCLPFMFVLLVAPLPPPLAHAVVTLLWATASVSSQQWGRYGSGLPDSPAPRRR